MRNFLTRFKAKPSYKKWYSLGIAAGVIFLPLLLLFPGATLAYFPFLILSWLLLAGGFFIWVRPSISIMWKSVFGKVLIPLLHALTFLLSTLYARSAIGFALGLPPQDFDLTVHILTLFIYLPMLATTTAIVLLIVGFGMHLIGILGNIASDFLRIIHQWIPRSIPPERVARIASVIRSDFVDHSFGAISLAICALVIGWGTINVFEAATLPAIRWIAFYADYYPAPAYPGIPQSERIRLHENGVISSAHIENGSVVISVRRSE